MADIDRDLDRAAIDAPPASRPSDDPAITDLIGSFVGATATIRSYASSAAEYTMISVAPSDWVTFAQEARACGFDTFIDLAAVDHYTEAPRYEVVVNLLDMRRARRILVSTRIPYDDPDLPTLTGVFAGANFYEREAYDLVGVVFTGHPDLTRILLPDEWEGHPLRKDYDVGAIPVEFKAGSTDL